MPYTLEDAEAGSMEIRMEGFERDSYLDLMEINPRQEGKGCKKTQESREIPGRELECENYPGDEYRGIRSHGGDHGYNNQQHRDNSDDAHRGM